MELDVGVEVDGRLLEPVQHRLVVLQVVSAPVPSPRLSSTPANSWKTQMELEHSAAHGIPRSNSQGFDTLRVRVALVSGREVLPGAPVVR